jgi:hypothetical protein
MSFKLELSPFLTVFVLLFLGGISLSVIVERLFLSFSLIWVRVDNFILGFES